LKYKEFEKKLLDLAMRTTDRLTAPFVAYHLEIRIKEAEEHLDQMTVEGHLGLDSDDDGNLFYEFPNLRRGSARTAEGGASALPQPARPAPPLPPRPPMAPYRPIATLAPQRHFSPAVAAMLSLLLPGLGQIYRGEKANGVGFLIAAILGYFLIVPGLIIHLVSIVKAAMPAPHVQYLAAPGPPRLPPPPPPPAGQATQRSQLDQSMTAQSPHVPHSQRQPD
jgi:hypothetical protein